MGAGPAAAGRAGCARAGCSNAVHDWLLVSWNEGMEKNMETTIMGYIGTTIRIHSFIPSKPKAR